MDEYKKKNEPRGSVIFLKKGKKTGTYRNLIQEMRLRENEMFLWDIIFFNVSCIYQTFLITFFSAVMISSLKIIIFCYLQIFKAFIYSY